jgi:hypothetical protein
MHDDTVTTSWRRSTDKVRGLRSESADYAFAGTSKAIPKAAYAVALENLPAAPAAMPQCRTDRDGEAAQQAARLATWEDEGGTTPS